LNYTSSLLTTRSYQPTRWGMLITFLVTEGGIQHKDRRFAMHANDIKEIIKAKGYDDFLTVRECADIFNTSTAHIYRKIKEGKIIATKKVITGKRFIMLDDICEALADVESTRG